LTVGGYKKIGKDKIKDLEQHQDKIDYDVVIEFYQNVKRKEREQIEEDKKKKLREVELWTRAIREEEKIAIEQYAEDHGDQEMAQIKESIKEKQAKELKERQALESAKAVFEAHMAKAMEKRHEEWEQRKRDYMVEKMDELKEAILQHAKGELQKDTNKQIIAEKDRERAARDRAIAAKKPEADGQGGEEDADNNWTRGANKPAA